MHPSQPWCAPRPQPSGNPGEDAPTRRSQTAAMAPMARGSSVGLGSYGATPGWGAVVFVFVWLLGTLCTAPVSAIQVTVSDPYHVVILFQPVTLPCTYQLTTTPTAPIVIWKYKSFCRDRIADAFSPASVDNQLNAQLAAGNPGYNPYVECQDSVRTVRVVATKQGNAVTLGDYYQGRRITITGNADLTFDQTAWGDSGVYYCSVVSAQDLQGNNEAYAELIVLDWLFVVVICLAVFLVFLLLGICWCQCCPHTCCCYVRCPCCPERCCCPEALYAAGKAATSGVPSIYAPSTYAYLSPAKTPPPGAMIPMGPVYNQYAGDFDRNSSVGGHSSQVPLLREADSSVTSVRSGYRIQASQQDDSMRVLYYMEKELANFDPSRPGPPNGRIERAMSEVTSLHEDDWRSRPSRGPALTPIRDEEWGHHSPHSPRRWDQETLTERPRSGWGAGRPRARSVDALDDLTWPSSAESGRRSPPSSGRRDRAYVTPRSRSRDDLYDQDNPRGLPHSQDPHYDDSRSRDRPHADPRFHYRHSRDPPDNGSRSRDPQYDGRLLEEALRKKGPAERKPYREEDEEEAYYPPAPPPYSETDSQASRERRLKKNLALSRESLVV
ncbi:lipolysis-stimulated lipoprotein receptor isoform X6 [Rousettus aegyptiacus]|uniref:lipolysis-stimulated lipoprotein receptor isoform X6 n=1 Tax=Rousettus aegyptiacus TaxID=9407 RepID=UPI00168D3F2A|nr:lipolysis-stimulated lipoprotein receptor isoform X6 [Rousettus aegyptiacus]